MSFQILQIAIYSRDRQLRSIDLKPDAVNVITGSSKAGKSALIDIVDYCLGSGGCHVPAGLIRDSVAWYAVRLTSATGELVVARPGPAEARSTSTQAMVLLGTVVELPEFDSLMPNADVDEVLAVLTRFAGIFENTTLPPTGARRVPFAVNLRHALLMCVQAQDEVANRGLLFHKQGEQFMPQAIKDAMPYLLGAVPDDLLQGLTDLARAQVRLRQAEKELLEAQAITAQGSGRATTLIREAQAVGLVAADYRPADWTDAVETLRRLSRQTWNPEWESGPSVDTYDHLLSERRALQDDLYDAEQKTGAVQGMIDGRAGYVSELDRQKSRLTSLKIFSESASEAECPVCGKDMGCDEAARSMARELEALESQFAQVGQDLPQLEALAARAREDAGSIRSRLAANARSLESIRKEEERVSGMRDEAARKAHLLGRLSLYCESIGSVEVDSALQEQYDQLLDRVGKLERAVDRGAIDERYDSMLRLVSRSLTDNARELGLEHAQNPLALDMKHLTVLADTPGGPIPMRSMGSGENYAGYHLAVHFALHSWFCGHKRPVPRFLFLDQPSQVYFPAEESRGATSRDSDWDAVFRLLEFVFKQTAKIGDLQVILIEHAELDESWFQEAIVERWRDGVRLVPEEWTT